MKMQSYEHRNIHKKCIQHMGPPAQRIVLNTS